jgi:hypothetical protein
MICTMAKGCIRESFTKRAGTACLSCRSRKIRCDVEQSQPCSNCLTDELDCETKKSLRGRKLRGRSKLNRKSSKIVSASTQDTTPNTSRVDESKELLSLCQVFPTYTTKWLENVVESETLSQCHSQGIYILSLSKRSHQILKSPRK